MGKGVSKMMGGRSFWDKAPLPAGGNWLQRWGAHAAKNPSSMKKNLWNTAGAYGLYSAFNNGNHAVQLDRAYGEGLGVATAHLKANPLQAMALPFTNDRYISNQLGNTPIWGGAARQGFQRGREVFSDSDLKAFSGLGMDAIKRTGSAFF